MFRQHLVRGALALTAFLVCFAGAERPEPILAAISLDDVTNLERDLAPGETHTYELSLRPGDFVRLSVEPEQIEMLVTLQSPTGEPLVSRMREHSNVPASTISVIARARGKHRLLVESRWPTSGSYVMRMVERRPALASDGDRIAAERAYAEGNELLDLRTAESLPAAIVALERALKLFRNLEDDGATADALNDIALIHMYRGDYQKSLGPHFQSLSLRQCRPDLTPRGESLDAIGYAYNSLGEMRKAITFLEAALRVKNPDIPGQAADTLHLLAVTYDAIGEGDIALQTYLQILPLLRKTGDRNGEGAVLHNIAVNRAEHGEWQAALDYGQQALRIWREQSYRRGEANTILEIGNFYRTRGEPERALSYYEKSLPLFREMGGRGEANALRNIGFAHLALGNLDQAIEQHQKALKLYRDTPNRVMEASVLAGLGRSHAKRGDLAKALQYYSEALPISHSAEDRSGEASILKAMAETELESGKPAEARASATQALEIFRAAGYRPGEAATLLVRARAWEAAGDLAAARSDVESALRLTEKLRGNISTHDARALFLASVAETSEFYIRLLMRLHEMNPDQGFDAMALQASEQARARSLVDLLAESRAGAAEHVERARLDRIRSVRERISAKAQVQLKLAGKEHSPQAVEIARELEELTAEYEQIMAEIRREDPALAAMASPEPLGLAQIRREVVDSSSVLLEYSLGETRSFLWVVTPQKLSSYELPPRAQIEAAVRTAYQALSAPGGNAETLLSVSKVILAPAAAMLRASRLVVIPDGALQYLPFAALPSPESGRPLIADHEIVTLPSASTIAILRRYPRAQKSSKILAVFADPIFDRTDSRLNLTPGPSARAGEGSEAVESEVVRSARESGLRDLPRLPFTRREAAAVLSLVPPSLRKQALDFEANRRSVMDADLGNYRFVHFATHGLLNNFHPELSGIVLSMVDEKGREQNGFVSCADVFNLSLTADLVVLSGCRTGLGKEIRGEGIAGLTRAFMYAGSPRVVASLWNVNDAATAELMKRFYQQMLGPNRLSPAAALRAAQLSLQKQKRWSAPYYWAAFVIQGEWK